MGPKFNRTSRTEFSRGGAGKPPRPKLAPPEERMNADPKDADAVELAQLRAQEKRRLRELAERRETQPVPALEPRPEVKRPTVKPVQSGRAGAKKSVKADLLELTDLEIVRVNFDRALMVGWQNLSAITVNAAEGPTGGFTIVFDEVRRAIIARKSRVPNFGKTGLQRHEALEVGTWVIPFDRVLSVVYREQFIAVPEDELEEATA